MNEQEGLSRGGSVFSENGNLNLRPSRFAIGTR